MRLNNRSLFKPRARVKGSEKIQDKADEATVYIYDEISWYGIQAETFIKDFNNLTEKTIHLRFNSPGGSVFDGTAMFNTIKNHKSRTIAHIDGLAASISSIVALAADEVRMSENAFMMIHDPWSMVVGSADDMRDEADLLDKVGGTIATTYINKTGKTDEEIKTLMAAETWMTADEALEMGFIDAIDKEERKEKATLFDLSVYANVPDQLIEGKTAPTAKDMEKALRDVGCSNKQAKAILSEGLQENPRDVDLPVEPPDPVQEPRDVVPEEPRDVVQPEKKKKDRTADLLTRAELVAPSTI